MKGFQGTKNSRSSVMKVRGCVGWHGMAGMVLKIVDMGRWYRCLAGKMDGVDGGWHRIAGLAQIEVGADES